MPTIAIVGSRDWPDPPATQLDVEDLVHALAQKHEHLHIVSGGARGVDRWAAAAARRRGIPITEHLADWDMWPHDAGFVRNQAIVDDADAVYAFIHDDSSGTTDTLRRARHKGIPVTVR